MPEFDFVRFYPNVYLPSDAQIEEFVILGKPPRAKAPGELPLYLGAGCVIRSHTVIYAGNRIGERLQTGHSVMIREENVIGDDVSIGTQSVVEHHVSIGSRVRLHTRVFVPEFSVLEDGCWLGPGVMVTNARYPISRGAKDRLEGVHIEAGAIIGAAAVLLPGVRIGARALIGAGAVVTKDVAPGAVMIGNPARLIKRVEDIAYYE
ncbi:MAG: transferase [Anaerolineae bacterium]|nr:transferase [Anaerolineae bacterium]NUQ05539.1 transferase [Anaerolineae bacterium]